MHLFYTPFYSPFPPELLLALVPFVIAGALWTVAIKGYALWHAARNNQTEWFIALLVINTVGILEIIYLIWFRPESSTRHSSTSHAHTPAHHSSAQA